MKLLYPSPWAAKCADPDPDITVPWIKERKCSRWLEDQRVKGNKEDRTELLFSESLLFVYGFTDRVKHLLSVSKFCQSELELLWGERYNRTYNGSGKRWFRKCQDSLRQQWQ